jgi:hypothetical protein
MRVFCRKIGVYFVFVFVNIFGKVEKWDGGE